MGVAVLPLLTALLLIGIGDLARGDSQCSPGWTPLHRACYRFVDLPSANWTYARESCQSEGAQLLVINDLAEYNGVKSHLKKEGKPWWVGLHKDGGQWQWLDGTSFVYRITRWLSGEPNNQGGQENCVEMNFHGKLNDRVCDSVRPYICEKSVPGATSSTRVAVNTTTTTTTTIITTITSTTTTSTTTTTARPETSAAMSAITSSVTKTSRNDVTAAVSVTLPQETMTSSSVLSPSTEDPFGNGNDDSDDDSNGKHKKRKEEEYAGCFRKQRLFHPKNNSCPALNASRASWPETPKGRQQSLPCRKGQGNMTFLCDRDLVCWRGQPNVDQCASKAFRQLLNLMSSEQLRGEEPEPEETLALTSELANVTRGDDVTEEDIAVTSKLIRNLVTRGAARKMSRNKKTVRGVVANVVSAGSNLVSRKRTALWSGMTREDKIRSATSLLVAMETATMTLAGELAEPISIVTRDENIELELRVVNVTSSPGEGGGSRNSLHYTAEDSDTQFSIPLAILTQLSHGELAKVVFMTHYTMGSLLDDVTDDDTQDVNDNQVVGGDENAPGEKKAGEGVAPPQLASHMVSASVVNSQNSSQLSQPVVFTIAHTKKIPPGFQTLCAFWNIDRNGLGAWSQTGCSQVSSNDTHTTCQCDHMTNFAVLMAVKNVEISEGHKLSLRVVTIVGCVISCICLLLSWVTFTCFPTLQGERNSIHKHLVVCLFVAEILFLSGIHQTANRVVCGIVAGVLHYVFLAAFLWMLMEGVHILLMLVQVFDASRSRLPYYCAAAYGPPLLVIAISAGVYPTGYGTDEYCWLTTERGFIWSFAGPVAVILFVNSGVLIYAMTMVCRHSDYVFSAKDKSSAGGIRSWIQGAMALEVLLGLTWIIGFLFLSQMTVAAAYIFTILNSMQGLFIFLFHCLFNKKVRKEYGRVLKAARQSSSSGSNTQSASLRNKLSSTTSFSNKHSGPEAPPTTLPLPTYEVTSTEAPPTTAPSYV